MKTKRAYPIFIKKMGEDCLIYIPDFEIYTEAKSFVDAIEAARDAIGLKGINLKDDKIELPCASTSKEALKKAEEDADEILDYSDGEMTYVDVDFERYRNKMRNRMVKKNCTIPYWLNKEAVECGINFSKTLQEALMQKVGRQ